MDNEKENEEYEKCVRGGCCDLRDSIEGRMDEPQRPIKDDPEETVS